MNETPQGAKLQSTSCFTGIVPGCLTRSCMLQDNWNRLKIC